MKKRRIAYICGQEKGKSFSLVEFSLFILLLIINLNEPWQKRQDIRMLNSRSFAP